MTELKDLINLHKKENLEFNAMSNKLLHKNFAKLVDMHINGAKTQSLTSYSALVKLYPPYKVFCYPETFLKENDLFVCKENMDSARGLALFNLLIEFPDINEFCKLSEEIISKLSTCQFIDWPTDEHKNPSVNEIEEMKGEINFIDFISQIKK